MDFNPPIAFEWPCKVDLLYRGAMGCLADAEVYGFVAGELDADALATVDEHLDRCPTCRRLVSAARQALATTGVTPWKVGVDEGPSLPAGSRVGRFEIEKEIGRGAMGVVYAARDHKLSRTVAVKLLRADRDDDGGSLLHEAKAMAQLAHPNVVTVFEAGEIEDGAGEVYVAMERVVGTTMREWLAAERPLRDVVGLLIAAGRGLAAAHAAGICHRDFKPENVLVGDDGRPRVSDFGLARAGAGAGVAPTALQRTERFVGGTPAYMAPELFSDGSATAKSDQFSYCVTLFEALAGERPFRGENLGELAAAARRGEVSWPVARQIPRRLRAAIERGLDPDPAARWPSMDALLGALAGAVARRRRLAVAAACGVAVLAVAAAVLLARRAEAPAPCASAAAPLDSVWNPGRAAKLEAAFGDASELAALTAQRIDAYAASWAAMRVDSCRETFERKTQSVELLDRRSLCLDRRLSELGATVAQMIADGGERAIEGPRRIADLVDLATCARSEALLGAVVPPQDAETRARIAELHQRIDRALTRDKAGESERAHETLVDIVAAARTLGYQPLVAEALQSLAASEQSLRRLDEAEEHLDEALAVASRAKDHARVANISVGKLYFFGAIKQEFATALALVEPARAAVMQAGGNAMLQGDLHMNTGVVYDLAGKRDRAETELTRALEIYRANTSAERPRIGDILHNLGALAMERGDLERARTMFEQALELRERVLGKRHPDVAATLLGLGAVARRAHRFDDARARYQRAAELFEAVLGPEHAQLGAVYNNLAIVESVDGNPGAAERYHRKALAIRRAAYGEEHPLVAQSMSGLAHSLSLQGRHEQALEWATRSLELRQKVYPKDHPSLAIGMHNRATILGELGRFREAAEQRRVALQILADNQLGAADMAEVRFAQARDLWKIGSHRQARTLALQARDGYASVGEVEAARLAEVDAWLAERPGSR